jgi:hypothetical protein
MRTAAGPYDSGESWKRIWLSLRCRGTTIYGSLDLAERNSKSQRAKLHLYRNTTIPCLCRRVELTEEAVEKVSRQLSGSAGLGYWMLCVKIRMAPDGIARK